MVNTKQTIYKMLLIVSRLKMSFMFVILEPYSHQLTSKQLKDKEKLTWLGSSCSSQIFWEFLLVSLLI